MIVLLEGIERYHMLRDELLVILDQTIFVGFLFLLELKKCFGLVQSLPITYKLRRKFSK